MISGSESNNTVMRGNISSESGFNINLTGKAFDVLSSGIYQNKIRAVVREISCNAYDAHKAIGIEDTPFIVNIPNSINPYFSVKDYGCGLATHDLKDCRVENTEQMVLGEDNVSRLTSVSYLYHNEPELEDLFQKLFIDNLTYKIIESTNEYIIVEGMVSEKVVDCRVDLVFELYTSYFSSTKSNSNDFIGAFGLGSKSPFAYTNTFNIVSIYNGYKRQYTAFIAEKGFPKVSLLQTSKTDEGNGVEVIVPVIESDFSNFLKECNYVYRTFDVKPEITGQTSVDFELDYVFKNKHKTVINSYNYGYSKYNAVQGNVVYDFDINTIQESNNSSLLANILHKKYSYLLHFDIGELSVAASRESLQLDEKTINAIRNKLNNLEKESVENFQREFKNKKSIHEAYKLLNGFYLNNTESKKIIKELLYKGKPVIEYKGYIHVKKEFEKNIKKIKIGRGSKTQRQSITEGEFFNNTSFKSIYYNYVKPNLLVVDDLPKGISVIKVMDHNVDLLRGYNNVTYIKHDGSNELECYINRMSNSMNDAKIIRLSTLEKPEKAKINRKRGNTTKYTRAKVANVHEVVKCTEYYSEKKDVLERVVELSGYYIEKRRKHYFDCFNNIINDELLHVLFNKVTSEGKKLYIVSSKIKINQFKRNNNMSPVSDIIDDMVDEFKDSPYYHMMRKIGTRDSYLKESLDKLNKYVSAYESLTNTTITSFEYKKFKYIDKILKILNDSELYCNIIMLKYFYGYDKNVTNPTLINSIIICDKVNDLSYEYEEDIKNILEKYNIFKLFNFEYKKFKCIDDIVETFKALELYNKRNKKSKLKLVA